MNDTHLQNLRKSDGKQEATCSYLRQDYKRFNHENLLRILSMYGDPHKLKVLYISTYRPRYTRTESLLILFNEIGLDVKTVLVGDSRLRYARALGCLLRYKTRYDVVFVAFRGHEILPIIRAFTRKPIIFDAFVSVYDTLCDDRCVFRPNSLVGRALKAYDKWLCRMSDVVLVDTCAHKEYFETQFEADNVEYLYVGCNEDLFRPMSVDKGGPFTVLWYGAANPLQGVDVILQAAKLLEHEKIRFRLIGPIKKKYGGLLRELDLSNVDMIDYIPYEELPMEINRADLCLGGHFSDKDKAKRVIAGKTFQFLACNKPTILGDNIANQELFCEGNLIHFVKMNDPSAIVATVREIL